MCGRGRRFSEALPPLLTLASLLFSTPAGAQDAHYWSQQYGTRSELLGGTVVGSPQDLSTTYYNPGGLAYLENQSFLLSALALEYETFGIQLNSDSDELGADRFGPAPLLVTGTLPRHWVEGTLAYSWLTRQRLETRIDAWETIGDGPDAPSANSLLDARVSESWGGLTWARRVGSLGLGVSGYFAYRSQRGREELLVQPIPTEVPVSAIATVNNYSYWHVRTLAKLGVHWERGGTTLGLTYTTPGLPLFGSGEAAYYRSVQVLVPAGPGIEEAEVAREPDVEVRSPMSVALGSRVPMGRGALYFTAEWFDAVDRYRVVTAPEIPTAGVGSALDALLTERLASVVNVGLGYEFAPRDDLTLFGSLITDFSATDDDPSSGHSFATWDIYQLTGGAAFTILRADFTLGVSRASGDSPINFWNDVEDRPFLPEGSVHYGRWKIFLGFELRGQGEVDAEGSPR